MIHGHYAPMSDTNEPKRNPEGRVNIPLGPLKDSLDEIAIKHKMASSRLAIIFVKEGIKRYKEGTITLVDPYVTEINPEQTNS